MSSLHFRVLIGHISIIIIKVQIKIIFISIADNARVSLQVKEVKSWKPTTADRSKYSNLQKYFGRRGSHSDINGTENAQLVSTSPSCSRGASRGQSQGRVEGSVTVMRSEVDRILEDNRYQQSVDFMSMFEGRSDWNGTETMEHTQTNTQTNTHTQTGMIAGENETLRLFEMMCVSPTNSRPGTGTHRSSSRREREGEEGGGKSSRGRDEEEGGRVGGGSRGDNENKITRIIDEKTNIEIISPPPKRYNYLTPVPLMERKWGSGDIGDGTPSDSMKGLVPLSKKIERNKKYKNENKCEGKKILSVNSPGSPLSRGNALSRGNVLVPVHMRASQTVSVGSGSGSVGGGGGISGVGVGVGERYNGNIDCDSSDRDEKINHHKDKDNNQFKKLTLKDSSDEKDEDDMHDNNEEIKNENDINGENNESYLSDSWFLKLSHASPLK